MEASSGTLVALVVASLFGIVYFGWILAKLFEVAVQYWLCGVVCFFVLALAWPGVFLFVLWVEHVFLGTMCIGLHFVH